MQGRFGYRPGRPVFTGRKDRTCTTNTTTHEQLVDALCRNWPPDHTLLDDITRLHAKIDEDIVSMERRHASQAADTAPPSQPLCTACGACCRFAEYGHRLYVPFPEVVYVAAWADGRVQIDQHTVPAANRTDHIRSIYNHLRTYADSAQHQQPDRCPFQDTSGQCTLRSVRPMGCRIFFCKADDEAVGRLCEHYLMLYKQLGDKWNLPYLYVDWMVALRAIADMAGVRTR